MIKKILYPRILPLIGGIIGVAMGLSYYLSIMIAQFFIGRPSSTWILGIYWLPIFLVKPVLFGVLIGVLAWLIISYFKKPRPLTQADIKNFKVLIIFLIFVSAAAGIMKIILRVN